MQTTSSNRTNPLSRPLTVFLLAAISCALWGSASPVIKTGYELFSIAESDTWTIILFAGLRFALAGLLVILFFSLSDRKPLLPKRQSWGRILCLSAFQTVGQYMFFYIGVAHCSGVLSAIFSGAGNLWAILLACFVLRQEKMTPGKLVGCLLGFGGILAMNLTGESVHMTLLGEGFLLLTGLCYGMSSGLAKIYSRSERPAVLTGWQFLLGGLVMILWALIMGGRLTVWNGTGFGVLVYLSLVSAVGYTLWAILLQHNAVSSVAVYGFMTPMFGVVISAILLGEAAQAFSLTTLAALAMVCAGIVAVNRFGSTKRHK